MQSIVAPVSTSASLTSTLRTSSSGRRPFDALYKSAAFSTFAVTRTLPIVSVPMVPSRWNESEDLSSRPLGGGDDLLGGVGEAVGGDDLAAALLEELLAHLDVGALEPDDQR